MATADTPAHEFLAYARSDAVRESFAAAAHGVCCRHRAPQQWANSRACLRTDARARLRNTDTSIRVCFPSPLGDPLCVHSLCVCACVVSAGSCVGETKK